MVDGIKAITKELIVPAKADRFLFTMAGIPAVSILSTDSIISLPPSSLTACA